MRYFSHYNPNIGLKFSAEALVNPPKKGFYFIICQLMYAEHRINHDDFTKVFTFSFYNWEISRRSLILFSEGFLKLKNIKFNEKTFFLIKVKMIELDIMGDNKIK